ncbi:TetR/AcrR family transcriptional regulator [Streptomyces acidiscabies]|uniref:TetR/AcrR family transcriptional regulator n=1 Tax=Streptomyces acidiscabies TaxID=42234 RepID=A0AAP6EI07_9ACTN|nr:TetR/AcrR family transcriptional regulator [Streptomyces acidiscabies]MBP5942079.1 TetR family transcriptional regulator [Streptomyces sp. LBUM 1476]MBZ3913570.1 TetR family transcriptional regulator [Streptomyces acidiscabies]MDX2963408.1 TetR/AcrR family transcriptional regulator [Streptomyces acidiscabies]MDX3023142.1 TetR/AcrR family transcriptional regulator [Streptomyces acidiscabies]MDX3792714.1 TetR/AcrR family transcriptional regulator [Streptomyces acidiscabies]
MTTEKTRPGLRERTRQAVRREITEAANALFIERGYEATTIDDIAAAVGMSKRSVFRYFPTKEDLVVGKVDYLAEEMLQGLRARPADEPVWQSLRALFDLLVPHIDDLDKDSVAAPIQRVIFNTPNLLGSYLEKQQQMQEVVVTALSERAAEAGTPCPAGDSALRAITAAAFGCLVAAQRAWLESGSGGTFADALDEAMAAVAPQVRL